MVSMGDIPKRVLPKPVKKVLKQIIYRYHNRPLKPYLKKKNIEGVIFDFWICDRVGRDWYDLQCTDPVWPEMRFIKDHLIRQGDVILECGGHHGCTAIVLSNWVGAGGKVVTFEPSPANCDIIEKNIRHNGLQNVILERKAVGAERGRITIDDESDSSVIMSGKGMEIEMTCLDEYKHLNPTFLKIDVEGFEMQVLQGAKNILATRPKLAVEIHTNNLSYYGASVQDLLGLIDVQNYKLWIQRNGGQPPVEYDMSTPIVERVVHLFGIPIEDEAV